MRWGAKPLICFGLSYVVFMSSAWTDKGDYPQNLPVVFRPSKLRSFEPFVCSDPVLEC